MTSEPSQQTPFVLPLASMTEREKDIVRAHLKGKSYRAIGRTCGCNWATAKRIILRYGPSLVTLFDGNCDTRDISDTAETAETRQ